MEKRLQRNKANTTLKPNEIVRKHLQEEEEQLSLLQGREQRINEKFSNKNLDNKNEQDRIVEFRNGNKISLSKLNTYLDVKPKEYKPTFPQELYLPTFKLNNWRIPKNGIISKKPHKMADYTKRFIYGRFWKEILPELERLNPSFEGVRMHKHYHHFTPRALTILKSYIDDYIRVIEKCKTWHEFQLKHGKEFGLPFQKSIFEEEN